MPTLLAFHRSILSSTVMATCFRSCTACSPGCIPKGGEARTTAAGCSVGMAGKGGGGGNGSSAGVSAQAPASSSCLGEGLLVSGSVPFWALGASEGALASLFCVGMVRGSAPRSGCLVSWARACLVGCFSGEEGTGAALL